MMILNILFCILNLACVLATVYVPSWGPWRAMTNFNLIVAIACAWAAGISR